MGGNPITFNGLSGIPVNDIITQLMQIERRPIDQLTQRKLTLNSNRTEITNVKALFENFQKSLKAISSTSALDANPFQVKKTTSSSETNAKATASETAASGTYSLIVQRLATATSAESTANVGQVVTGTALLNTVAQGTVTNGNFTVFVNGVANNITVDTSQDVDSVLSQISGLAGVQSVSIDADGKISVQEAAGNTVALGASADTSNFLSATALNTGVRVGDTITSSRELTTIDLSATVDTAAARTGTAVTSGSTFTIGSATFDTTGKSISDLITEINASSSAGVNASFNFAENKLELTSKSLGSNFITLADTSGNFLEAMGLISGGNSTASQTAGQTAEFSLNGVTLFSSSNSVGESVTGLTGVTFELLKQDPLTTVTIGIQKDSDNLKAKFNDFIEDYNAIISKIDTLTDPEEGILKSDSGLRGLRNQIRQLVSDRFAGGGDYDSLQMIGITTGAPTSGTVTTTSLLQFDSAKFDAALAADPSGVEDMVRGASGMITRMSDLVENALHDDASDSLDGFFAARNTSINKQIESFDESIDRAELRLENKEKLLRQQFLAMESAIARFNQQGSALSGLNQQIAANR